MSAHSDDSQLAAALDALPTSAPEKIATSQHIEDNIGNINSTANIARGLYTGFLALTLYIMVTLGLTDDKALFYNTPVALPVINISVDLVSFYRYVPWLYLLIHANLLLILALLADKIFLFNKLLVDHAYPDRLILRKRLHAMIFTQYIGGHNDNLVHALVAMITWVTVFMLPATLLVAIQQDFLPAQYEEYIWEQRAAVALDILISIIFFGLIVLKKFKIHWPEGWQPSLLRQVGLSRLPVVLYLIFLLAYSLLVLTIPLSNWERRMGSWLGGLEHCLSNEQYAARHPQNKPNGTPIPKDEMVSLARTIAVKKEQILLLDKMRDYKRYDSFVCHISEAQTPWVRRIVSIIEGLQKWVPFEITLKNSLTLPREEIVVANTLDTETENKLRAMLTKDEATDKKAPLLNKVKPINISELRADPRFRFANFKGVIFPPKTNFSGIDLLGANLSGSYLKDANLSGSYLQGANLSGAYLQDANLSRAHLQNANLSSVHLQNAVLESANLQGVNKTLEVNFEGVDLLMLPVNYRFIEISSHGANPRRVNLQNADLSGSYLQGANLWGGNLQGADLRKAKLQGADLEYAELQGADLEYAELQGVDLGETKFHGADLRKAKLQGADLREAKLQGADLREAKLQGADLEYAELQGANLNGARFDWAYFLRPRLTGFTESDQKAILTELENIIPESSLKQIQQRLIQAVDANDVFHDSEKQNCQFTPDAQTSSSVLKKICTVNSSRLTEFFRMNLKWRIKALCLYGHRYKLARRVRVSSRYFFWGGSSFDIYRHLWQQNPPTDCPAYESFKYKGFFMPKEPETQQTLQQTYEREENADLRAAILADWEEILAEAKGQ